MVPSALLVPMASFGSFTPPSLPSPNVEAGSATVICTTQYPLYFRLNSPLKNTPEGNGIIGNDNSLTGGISRKGSRSHRAGRSIDQSPNLEKHCSKHFLHINKDTYFELKKYFNMEIITKLLFLLFILIIKVHHCTSYSHLPCERLMGIFLKTSKRFGILFE